MVTPWLFSLLLTLCCLAGANGHVHILTDSNFDEKVSTGIWLVQFHAPWCGHCAKLLPVWEEAAEQVGVDVSFGKVDSTVEKRVAARMAIKGYPTIKVFAEGSSQPTMDYTGPRDLAHLVRLAEMCARPAVQPVTGTSIHKLGATSSAFLLVVDESEESHAFEEIYRSVAKTHKFDAEFYYATANDAAEYLTTNRLPALLVAKNGRKLIYDGPMEFSPVESWVMSERHTLVMELGPGVFGTVTMREIVNMDKLIVIGMKGNANPADSQDMTQAMWSVAKRLDSGTDTENDNKDATQALANRYVFLLADGDAYFSLLTRFFVLRRAALPLVAVLNATTNRYYLEPITLPGRYTPQYLMAFLQNIAAGRVQESGSKYDSFIQMSRLVWYNMKELAYDSPWIFGVMLGLPIFFITLAFALPAPDQDEEIRRIATHSTLQGETNLAEQQAKPKPVIGHSDMDDNWTSPDHAKRQGESGGRDEGEESEKGNDSSEPKSGPDKKRD